MIIIIITISCFLKVSCCRSWLSWVVLLEALGIQVGAENRPKWPQEGPKSLQDRPRWSQEGLKRAQENSEIILLLSLGLLLVLPRAIDPQNHKK